MKVQIRMIRSMFDIPYGERFPVAKLEHLGKTASVTGSKGKTLMIILPCGHMAIIDGWNITDIETDKPSATPSIFCKGIDGKDCWHGYLKEGKLVPV